MIGEETIREIPMVLEAELLPQPQGPFSLSPWVENLFGRGEYEVEAFFRCFEPAARDPFLNEGGAYGGLSTLSSGESLLQPWHELLTDHPLFQGVILLLAVAYLLMLCASGSELLSLFGRKRLEPGRSTTVGAINTSAIMGLIMAAALAVHYAEGGRAAEFGSMPLLASILGLLVALPLLQSLLLVAVGQLTLSLDLTREIIRLKVGITAIASLLGMPFALLLVLSPPGEGEVWIYPIGLVCIILLLLYLKESFLLFISKKVSILHWFLYLCAVELLPISFIVIKAMRW